MESYQKDERREERVTRDNRTHPSALSADSRDSMVFLSGTNPTHESAIVVPNALTEKPQIGAHTAVIVYCRRYSRFRVCFPEANLEFGQLHSLKIVEARESCSLFGRARSIVNRLKTCGIMGVVQFISVWTFNFAK